MNENNESLATELLHEFKAQAKRWFIMAMVELGIIALFVVGMLWYFSLPTDDYSYTEQSIEANSSDANTISNTISQDY